MRVAVCSFILRAYDACGVRVVMHSLTYVFRAQCMRALAHMCVSCALYACTRTHTHTHTHTHMIVPHVMSARINALAHFVCHVCGVSVQVKLILDV
ncbi:MAG: hypothetical protein AMXMBFR44_6970 [Candidatus Campbellbacteria bacterium]